MTLREYLVQELAALPDWFLVAFVLSALVGACVASVALIACGFAIHDAREAAQSSSGDGEGTRQLDARAQWEIKFRRCPRDKRVIAAQSDDT